MDKYGKLIEPNGGFRAMFDYTRGYQSPSDGLTYLVKITMGKHVSSANHL